MASDTSSGTASYRGYEYQLLGTVWVALDLMLRQGVCSTIDIEPPSQEDIDAMLAVPPEKAESGVTSAFRTLRIHVQIKLSGTPWTVGDLGHVVEGESGSVTPPARGPKRRSRALENLAKTPTLQYVLLTNAEVAKGLKDYCVKGLGEESAAIDLPSSWSIPPGANAADLAKRLCILEKLEIEVLEHRIFELLMRYGYVPPLDCQKCLSALLDDARARLLRPAAWTKEQVEDRLRQFDGTPSPTSEMSAFVAPSNFEQIQRSLEAKYSVILLGPPGVGKTLVADMLVYEYRRQTPCKVVYEEKGPHYIRECLSKPEPFLFYLRDPWGDYRLRHEASTWITELPKLLLQARADKRFLVTSRTAILDQAGSKPSRKLFESYAINIEPQHYPLRIRKQLLLKRIQSASPRQREFVNQHERQIMGALTVPFSIVRFSSLLMKKRSGSSLWIDQLLKRAQVESVQATVVDEVCGRGDSGCSDAVVLWAWLNAFRKASPRELELLNDAMEAASELTGLLRTCDWMTTAGWLRKVGSDYEASHPTVMQGLESLFRERPDQARRAIKALLQGLVSLGHASKVQKILQHTRLRNLTMPLTVRDAVNQHLLEQLLALGDGNDHHLVQACQAVASWSTARDAISLLAAALVPMPRRDVLEDSPPQPDDTDEEANDDESDSLRYGIPSYDSFDFESWQDPTWSPQEFEQVSKSKEALSLAGRFIEECLADVHGFDGERLLALFARLGWDLSEHFVNAAWRAVCSGSQHCKIIFQGAISGRTPPYDELLGWLLDELDELEKDDPKLEEQWRAADQEELDEQHAEYILEGPNSERYWSIREALEFVVQERRRREGYNWLLEHPRRQSLLASWAATVSTTDDAKMTEAEVHALLDACPKSDPRPAWTAIGRTRQHDLLSVVDRGLDEGLFPSACIQALANCLSPEEFGTHIRSVAKTWPFERRASLVFQTNEKHHLSTVEKEFAYREALNSLLDSIELEAVKNCLAVPEQNSLPSQATHILTEHLSPLLQLARNDLDLALRARALCRLAMGQMPDLSLRELAAPCMRSEDYHVRYDALRSLALLKTPSADADIACALADQDYRCRQFAVEVLAERATPEIQSAILGLAKDRSAGVRTACARAIGQQRWSLGETVLLTLLHDSHNAGRGQWAFYDVAREAARAFRRLHPVDGEIFEELFKFLETEVEHWGDLGVPFLLIDSLMPSDDPRLMALLTQLLEHPGYSEGSKNPGYPLRYASAWLMLKHLWDKSDKRNSAPLQAITVAAQDSDGRLAGPALLMLGLLGETAERERRQVSQAPETTAERRVLLAAAERLFKRDGAATADGQPLPGFRALAWLEANSASDASEWKNWLGREPEVLSWLKSTEATADVNPCLRFVLSGFSKLKRAHLSHTDLRDRDL